MVGPLDAMTTWLGKLLADSGCDTRLASDPAAEVLRMQCVQLSPGADFAQHTPVDTRPFARLNFATTPELLDEILARVSRAIDE